MRLRLLFLLGVPGVVIGTALDARDPAREQAVRAAIHPVADTAMLRAWLSRVPVTRDFPPDFGATLQGQAPAFVIEMSTAPDCIACADLWARLETLRGRYGLRITTLSTEEAMLRSGRLGLPWVGHPVAWVRPANDVNRTVPVAIGTDHAVNVARNLYLGFKMLSGVRADVGVRALSKFTGIVGASAAPVQARRKD